MTPRPRLPRRLRVARPSRRQRFAAFGIGPAPDYYACRAFTIDELDADAQRRWMDEYGRLIRELRVVPPTFDVNVPGGWDEHPVRVEIRARWTPHR